MTTQPKEPTYLASLRGGPDAGTFVMVRGKSHIDKPVDAVRLGGHEYERSSQPDEFGVWIYRYRETAS